MEHPISILKTTALFKNIDEMDIQSLLGCLHATTSHVKKGQLIIMSGDRTNRFGIVLEGQIQISYEDYYGNKNILGNIDAGGLFGGSFAFTENKKFLVNVTAITASTLLFIDHRLLAAPCAQACPFHQKLIQNMLHIMAEKNIQLVQKIEFTSKRTTREKLLAFLSFQAQAAGNSKFSIPYNRQELADYLSVDRSAMSAELCKLRDSGILKFHKNRFELQNKI